MHLRDAVHRLLAAPGTPRPSVAAAAVGGALAVLLGVHAVAGGATLAAAAPPATASEPSAGPAAPTAPPATQPLFDAAPVQALVDEAAARGVRLSVGVQSLDGATLTDGPVVVGSTEDYASASLIKVALVTTVLRQVDRGALSLDQVETVTGADVVAGSGVLAGYPLPYDATVAELAELAITVSDNTASNVLAELVGLDAVDALVADLHLEPTHMGRLFFSSTPKDERNVLDTASTVELLRALYEDDVLSDASRELLLGWMRGQQLDTKFAPALPGVPLASKTGDTSTVNHDGAYLLEPGRETVLVVLSETSGGRSASAATPYLARAATLVHDQVAAAPPAPTPTPTVTPTPSRTPGSAGVPAGGGASSVQGAGADGRERDAARREGDVGAGGLVSSPVLIAALVLVLAALAVLARVRWRRRP